MTKPGGPIYFVSLNQKTIFMKLADVFPECFLLRERNADLEPMQCLNTSCPANKNCMETLCKRVNVLFQEILPEAELIILYYRKRNIDSMGGSLFWRDLREPRNIVINPWGWQSVKKRSQIFKFEPGPHFFLSGNAPEPKKVSDDLVKMT